LSEVAAVPSIADLQAMLDSQEFTSAYGFQVVAVGGGEATVRVPYLKRWDRPGGILSGQVYMNAADCAMWVAILGNFGFGPMSVTTELNTSFLGAAREEDITCTARILRNGRRLIYGVADCYGSDGRQLTHHMLTYARADA
jgi:acyl-coenzyme A thioesterase PaaI-like protein